MQIFTILGQLLSLRGVPFNCDWLKVILLPYLSLSTEAYLPQAAFFLPAFQFTFSNKSYHQHSKAVYVVFVCACFEGTGMFVRFHFASVCQSFSYLTHKNFSFSFHPQQPNQHLNY